MKKATKIGIAAGVAAFAILGWSVGRELYKRATRKTPVSIEQIHKKDGVPVVTSPVVMTNLSRKVSFDAVIEPDERGIVMSEVSTRVTKVHVREGDKVRGGDNATLLIELDDEAAAAAAQAAEKAYEDATNSLNRARRLLQDGAISRQDYDGAAVAEESARAALIRARNTLRNCRVFSPITGMVSRRYVDPGQVPGKGTVLMEVVDVSRLEAELTIPENRTEQVRVGMPCRVHVGVLGSMGVFDSSIAALNPELDPRKLELKARCCIKDPPAALKAGMFATVEVESDSGRNVTAVLERAVVELDGETGVFTVDKENLARFKTVETGIGEGGFVEVVSGVSAGDSVVTDGNMQIEDGDRVRVKGTR
ncbi:MAG: efflux RND transporter periplasmic adaptor subunit [Kiritimatiellia bacterium]